MGQTNVMDQESLDLREPLIKKRNRILYYILLISGFIPLFFFAIGFFLLFRDNNRDDLIQAYNQQVEDWTNSRKVFHDLNFKTNEEQMAISNIETGSYWPTRDSCIVSENESSRCKSTKPYSYVSHYTLSSLNTLRIDYMNNTLFTTPIIKEKNVDLSIHDLQCTIETECIILCEHENGKWNKTTKLCSIHKYLNNICIRVKQSKGSYSVDLPPLAPILKDVTTIGCYKNTNYSPFYYSTEFSEVLKIEVRHSQDPLILSTILSNGCSFLYPSSTSCFESKSSAYMTCIMHIFIFGSLIYYFKKNSHRIQKLLEQSTKGDTTVIIPSSPSPNPTVIPTYSSFQMNSPRKSIPKRFSGVYIPSSLSQSHDDNSNSSFLSLSYKNNSLLNHTSSISNDSTPIHIINPHISTPSSLPTTPRDPNNIHKSPHRSLYTYKSISSPCTPSNFVTINNSKDIHTDHPISMNHKDITSHSEESIIHNTQKERNTSNSIKTTPSPPPYSHPLEYIYNEHSISPNDIHISTSSSLSPYLPNTIIHPFSSIITSSTSTNINRINSHSE
ncbi:hypothetical protein WA158_002321 [Blastocystis sp. Blastoise]